MADESMLRDRLHRTQRELDNERHRNEALYQAFLPKDVVDLVHRGQVPTGGKISRIINLKDSN